MMNDENRYKAIGAKIREAREAAGLSQKALAEQLGYESSTAISYIESGDRKIAVVDLEKVAEVLDRDIAYFMGMEAQPMNVRVALRAEEGLDKKDQEAILHIIDMAKRRAGGN